MSFQSVKRSKKANRCILWREKVKKMCSGFVIYSYLKDSTFTAAVKRDYTHKGDTICQ